MLRADDLQRHSTLVDWPAAFKIFAYHTELITLAHWIMFRIAGLWNLLRIFRQQLLLSLLLL